MKLMTSLQEIYDFKPCEDGWMRAAEPRSGLDWKTTFPLIDCCNTNTFSDVCWLLGKRKVQISVAVRAAGLRADSVAHLRSFRTADAYADAYDAYVAAYAADADAAARKTQQAKNMNFLRQAILEFEANLETSHGTTS